MEKKNEKKLSEHPASTPAKAEKSKQSSVAVQKPKQVKKKITEAAVIEQAVESLKVGRLKNFLNMSVAPLVGLAEEKGPEYLTMTEALAGDLLEVTEIDHGGFLPNLTVRKLG